MIRLTIFSSLAILLGLLLVPPAFSQDGPGKERGSSNAVGAEHGVHIGRIGVRLRNPSNTGPAWAASLIESRADTPVFVNLSNNSAAALLPIKLQSQCLMCHGSKEQIAPIIQQQLTKLYPNDEAVGFQEGELRGWFWIEKQTP